MKKKKLALLLAVTMTVMSLSGCGNGESSEMEKAAESQEDGAGTAASSKGENDVDGAETEESGGIAVDAYAGTTLKIAVKKKTLDQCTDFNEKPGFKMAEEATGIHIEWMTLDEGSENEKVNIMLASDMPDAVLNLLNENHISNNIDLFYDLSEEGLLETYAPDVYADILTMEGGLGTLTWPDGSIRSLPTSFEVSYANDPDGIMVINQKWLDQLQMDIPTTGDELYDVLCAFRDNDMNGNGDNTDEIPMEFAESEWAANIINLANSFGIAGDASGNADAFKMVKDGKVVPTANTEEFRSFLEYAHKLVSEGLLDVEGFSQTNEQFHAKLKEQVVGCYWSWTPRTNMDVEYAKDYVPMKPVQALEGVKPVKTGRKNRLFANRTGLAVSKDCTNVQALLHWWNYLSSSTEMKYTVKRGEKGQLWDIVDGRVVSCTPEGLTNDFTDENYKYTYGVEDGSPFIRKDEAIEVDMSDPMEPMALRKAMVDEVWDCLQDEYIPVKFADPAKVDERQFIEIELFNSINNFMATSIVEGVTDESWEAYLNQLDALQYSEWIDWYQKFYDGEY